MPTDPPPPPTEVDVLRWCADGVWFPTDHPPEAPRSAVDKLVRRLWQSGLIEVADWAKGRGQGFRLTPAGRQVLDPSYATSAVDLTATPPPADRGELTREAFLAPGPVIVTPALLLACLVWYGIGIVAIWRHGEPIGRALAEMPSDGLLKLGAMYGPRLYAGDWWRLVTSTFVHTSGLHLLGNLFALALLGPVAEWLWGRWRFGVLFVVSGFASASATAALYPEAVACGASGAAWGVLFAVVAWLVRYRDHLPPDVLAEWARRLLWVIGANALVSLLPGTAWEGHLTGGVFGILAGGMLDRTRLGGRRRLILGSLGLLTLPVVAGGLLVGMMQFSPDWRQVRELADPVKQEAMLRELVARIDPSAVAAALTALPDRGPAARLKAAAVTAQNRVPNTPGVGGQFHWYARAVGRFADELLDPTSDSTEMKRHQRQLITRWRTLASSR